MRVEYGKTILDKLYDIRRSSQKEDREVICVWLSDAEWGELVRETRSHYGQHVWREGAEESAERRRSLPPHARTVVRVFGLTVELEGLE